MKTPQIEIGDNVRHKTKFLNENMTMTVSAIQNNQAQCEHFESNEEGGTTHKKSWFLLPPLAQICS